MYKVTTHICKVVVTAAAVSSIKIKTKTKIVTTLAIVIGEQSRPLLR